MHDGVKFRGCGVRLGLARTQRFLSPFQRADIEVDARPAGNLPLIARDREAAGEPRMPVPVHAATAKLEVPVSLGSDAFLPRRNRAISILRMQHVTPAEIGALF